MTELVRVHDRIRVKGAHGPAVDIYRCPSADGRVGVMLERGELRLSMTVATAIAIGAGLHAIAEEIRLSALPKPAEVP